MSAKKVIVVFGATGNQGGSVVKALLGDPKTKSTWTVRGVTRDVSKPSAKKLESLGAETVAADLNDPASLKNAVKGAYAVFAVTNFWDSRSADVEFNQGKSMVDAAKEAGVQHYIWSSLLNITKLSGGVLTGVQHFDSKAKVEDYVRSTGIPASFFLPGYFMSNLIPGGVFRQGPDGNYALSLPVPGSAIVPLLDTGDDVGKFVKGILLNREKTLGKRILGAAEYKTLDEVVAAFKEQFPVAGKGAKYVEISHETFKSGLMSRGMDDVSAEDILQNMRLLSEFGYYGKAPLDESHSIVVDKLTTWKEFMQKTPGFAELN